MPISGALWLQHFPASQKQLPTEILTDGYRLCEYAPMKRLLLLLSLLPVCVSLAACGGTGKGATAASHAAPNVPTTGASTTVAAANTPVKNDEGPNDNDDGPVFNDDTKAPAPVYTPTAADKRKIAVVVKRYYTAAVAGDAVAGCSMLRSALAKSIAEDYGQAPGPSFLRGAKTCVAVMSRMFSHYHSQLVAEAPTLKVTAVRFDGEYAIATLSFKALPALELPVELDRGGWKIDQMLASSS
jgi:hypothetical protein